MGKNENGGELKSSIYESSTQILWNLLLITSGSIICAIAVNAILIPQNFFSAGFTGIALFAHYLFPSIPVGTIYLLLNIPMFIIGWSLVGRRFFYYSIAGMAIFTFALYTINLTIPIHDKILSALLAGIVNGVGSGIVLRSMGSAGGTDILCVILQKIFSIKVGTSTLIFNGILLGIAGITISIEGALYTLVFLYVNTQVLNLVVLGLSKRKAVFIISDKWENISEEILKKDKRGVTIIEGIGGYRKENKRIIYSIIAFQDLPVLKKMISDIDPGAFVVVMDTLEVMGARIGNQPQW
ncbi:MAG TPA: YitT family protein [Deltaproteobacteria bacterium]|nr:YitT family protein [Deltaproteobacteria bacterium]